MPRSPTPQFRTYAEMIAEANKARAERDRYAEALENLLDRQHDYPTDLSRDPEWAAAYRRGWEALGDA